MAKSNKPLPQKVKNTYLDYAAGAQPNPSSIHELGVEARAQLEQARQKVAEVLNARPREIIFTSGGTESNNLAIQGAVWASRPFLKKENLLPHIIITNIEHPSVIETCRMLEKRGLIELGIVPIEPNGIVTVRKIQKEIRSNTILISVMYANNEIGTLQPIREIAKMIRHYKKITGRENIYFHTDAVQGVNYLDLNVEKLGVDMLSVSGTKIEEGGRAGVLFKKASVPLENIMGGGGQEQGLRPGTENLAAIVSFAQGFVAVQKRKEKESKRLENLREYFISKLSQARTPDVQRLGKDKQRFLINGDQKNRLPNNINITFSNIPSDLLVIELSARGIMASAKSACESSNRDGSYVISALRKEENPEIGGLRFSFGSDTTKRDIDRAVKALEEILVKLERWY